MSHADRSHGNGVLRREWRQLGLLALESVGTGLFVSLVLALAVFIISFEASAAGTEEWVEAHRTYQNAKAEGRKTALAEQARPNMFTTNVANIGPGEEIVVALEYQETPRYDDGSFRLRFPMAITPRYIPGAVLKIALPGEPESSLVRQVVFLTDGAVGNEDEILRLLHDKLGARR